jgi:hypothetical protein
MFPINDNKNIHEHFVKITSYSGPIKLKFLKLWEELYRDIYSEYGQYGKCLKNNTTGVLTPKGNWSPINQFNTNYTINVEIAQKVNEWIMDEFIFRGIDEVEGRNVKEITFDKVRYSSFEDYISEEIENYFFWLRYYKDRIFIDQNLMCQNDFLYQLFETASRTLGSGTYAEFCIEYFYKKKYPFSNIFRTSSIRGDLTDMVGGCDLFIYDKDDSSKIKKFQSKVVRIDKNNVFNKQIDVKTYLKKGINYLVLVSLNYDYKSGNIKPDRMIFLRIDDELIIKLPKGFTYNKENLVMTEKIDDIFHSQVFFEFFVYCTKNDVEFSLEVGENTSFEFIESERKINAVLPKESKNFNHGEIKDVWLKIIDSITTKNEDKESMYEKLENLFKN